MSNQTHNQFKIRGRPEIDPFHNIVFENPFDQASKRHFRSLPQHNVLIGRKKFVDLINLVYRNPNNVAKPVINFNDLKIAQKPHIKTLMQDTGLPTGISKQLPHYVHPATTKPSQEIAQLYKSNSTASTHHPHRMHPYHR